MSPIEEPIVFKMGIARTGFRPGENQLAIRRPCKAGRIVPMLVVGGQLNGSNLFPSVTFLILNGERSKGS